MTDPIDENAGATPGDEPAGAIPEEAPAGHATPAAEPADEAPTDALPAAEAPTTVQAAAAPVATAAPVAAAASAAAAAPMAAPPRSWFRKRWVLITAGVAAAVVLLLGGVAIGAATGGHDARDGHRGADGPGQSRQDGKGFGPQADGQGRGSFDRDGGGGFGQGGQGQGGQPQQGQPQPNGTPQAQSSSAPAQ